MVKNVCALVSSVMSETYVEAAHVSSLHCY